LTAFFDFGVLATAGVFASALSSRSVSKALSKSRHQVRPANNPWDQSFLHSRRHAGLLDLDHLDHRLLIAIVKLRGVEVRLLRVEDMLGKLKHVLRDSSPRTS
jgi:hypothetical protein